MPAPAARQAAYDHDRDRDQPEQGKEGGPNRTHDWPGELAAGPTPLLNGELRVLGIVVEHLMLADLARVRLPRAVLADIVQALTCLSCEMEDWAVVFRGNP